MKTRTRTVRHGRSTDAAAMTESDLNGKLKSTNAAQGMSGIATRVRCDGFICMAYLDAEGKWRNYYTKEVLPPVLEILSSEEK